MPWWYPFGCIAFIVGGILIFLKPEWLWALTEQWKSYAADGPSDFYILSTKISGVLFTVFGVVALVLPLGNADAVPQPPERCLSRQAGIVRYCLCFFTK